MLSFPVSGVLTCWETIPTITVKDVGYRTGNSYVKKKKRKKKSPTSQLISPVNSLNSKGWLCGPVKSWSPCLMRIGGQYFITLPRTGKQYIWHSFIGLLFNDFLQRVRLKWDRGSLDSMRTDISFSSLLFLGGWGGGWGRAFFLFLWTIWALYIITLPFTPKKTPKPPARLSLCNKFICRDSKVNASSTWWVYDLVRVFLGAALCFSLWMAKMGLLMSECSDDEAFFQESILPNARGLWMTPQGDH